MPVAIASISLDQFIGLLKAAALTRHIDSIHLHHTYRPRKRDFRGERTVRGMQRYHIKKGFRDIAQHLTIGPDGDLWTGRPWEWPPASARGNNGTSEKGPFMIEMVGDFDTGKEALADAQRAVVVRVLAALLQRFKLPLEQVLFHRDLPGASKTCPGSSIDRAALLADVPNANQIDFALSNDDQFEARYLRGSELFRDYSAGKRSVDDHEVPEGPGFETFLRDELMHQGGARVSGERLSPAQIDRLRPHIVNMSLGSLSSGGDVETTVVDLAEVFGIHIPKYVAEQDAKGEPANLLIFAHGGLVRERKGLQIALRDLDWWRANGVFPLFFVWETGLLETLTQQMIGSRNARGLDDVGDWILERTLRPVAGRVWGGMKESAANSCDTDLGDGEPGGAYQVAQHLKKLAKAHPDVRMHAVGHSAGSIILSHFVQTACRGATGVTFESLQFLAPAIRNDVFHRTALPEITRGKVNGFTLFTMTRSYERKDTVARIYRKSLLYFVSRACEPKRKTPILGLESSLRDDEKAQNLFSKAGHDLVLASPLVEGEAPRPKNSDSRATTHGGFDEDPATMESVLRRILDLANGDDIAVSYQRPRTSLGSEQKEEGIESDFEDTPQASVVDSMQSNLGPQIMTPQRRGLAVCIGIDNYNRDPLQGCINDMNLWRGVLEEVGYKVHAIEDADWGQIHDGLERLVRDTKRFQHSVFQFAGHGTYVPDLNRDEKDPNDEALVPIDWESGQLFLDDDIGRILDGLQTDARITLFVDSCHSGSVARFSAPIGNPDTDNGVLPRFLELKPVERTAHQNFRGRMHSSRSNKQTLDLPKGAIQMSACQDHQYAYETNGQGDFTRAAASLLVPAVIRNQPIESFFNQVLDRFGNPAKQTPNLLYAGDLKEPLLSSMALS